MKKYFLLMCFLLVGCIPSQAYFSHRQNGKDIYVAKCGGAFADISYCYRQASEACNGNFAVMREAIENTGSNIDVAPVSMAATQNNFFDRLLMFYCK